MKFRHVLPVIFGLVVISLISSYFDSEKPAPRSPATIYTTNKGQVPGSGHAFGYGMIYTVVEHTKYDDKSYAVVKSVEPDVEIWTPIPQVVAMTDGMKFHVVKASTFDEALKVISSKNH